VQGEIVNSYFAKKMLENDAVIETMCINPDGSDVQYGRRMSSTKATFFLRPVG
jgi:hypothetical protein